MFCKKKVCILILNALRRSKDICVSNSQYLMKNVENLTLNLLSRLSVLTRFAAVHRDCTAACRAESCGRRDVPIGLHHK